MSLGLKEMFQESGVCFVQLLAISIVQLLLKIPAR